MSFGARAEIRLDALTKNFEKLRDCIPGSRVMAAVKANAYGHGLVTVSKALASADALAVARLCEAAALRRAAVSTDIVLMGGVINREDVLLSSELACDLVVHTSQQVDLLESVPTPPRRVWLKIDSGMHRLGVPPEAAADLIARLRNCDGVGALGLMTHLANADDTADPMSRTQFGRFAKAAEGFEGDISVANSAALLGWRDDLKTGRHWMTSGETWVRPGIALYGISPLSGVSADDLGLEPVMNFDTVLLSVRPLAAGEPVGYGGTWSSQEDTVLGIAAAGYGDGYSRFIPSGTPVLVNGRRASIAGVVSMDLLAIDLGPGAGDRIGDSVRLWGDGLPVEEIAAAAGTTAYPLVTGVVDRAGGLR